MKNSRWWVWSASLVAVLMVVFAVGNLIDDDGGPLYGQLILAAIFVGGAAAVVFGIRKRSIDTTSGNRMIGLGVLPGVAGLALFWFPPAVAVGVLAAVTSVAALRDTKALPSAVRATGYGAALLVLVLTVISVGVA